MRRIPIGKAYYEVNDSAKTFRFISRNKFWRKFSKEKNQSNKKSIDGYFRVNKDGSRTKFIFKGKI